MKKLALPLVMLASLATLVSCGEKNAGVTPNNANTPVVTGQVVTGPTTTGSTQSPVVLTRKETLSYNTPEGMVPVEFDVTVTDGVITAVAAKNLATKDASKYNQDNFAKAVSAKVVGKKAKDLKVDAIGGASLTTAAFEQFVHSF